MKAPSVFALRQVGKTLLSCTVGMKIASDALEGRVYEVSLADLQKSEHEAYRKIRLRCEEVQGRACLTNFHGMDLTRDKLCSLVRKWQTLIDVHVDVKTTDTYGMVQLPRRRQKRSDISCHVLVLFCPLSSLN